MFRPGITRLSDVPEDVRDAEETLPVSLALLADVPADGSARSEQIIELLNTSLPSGHTLRGRRRTFVNRYGVVDEAIGRLTRDLFAADKTVRVHELAASNGVASLELYRHLSSILKVSVHSSDLHTRLYVVRAPGSRWSVVFNEQKKPLQFVGRRTVIWIAAREPGRFPVNRLLKLWLTRTVLPVAQRLVNGGSADSDPAIRTVSLFHPRCLAMAENDAAFTCGSADMLTLEPQAHDVVRAMSAFSTLPPDILPKAIDRVAESVADGGLLVIGRNRGRHSDVLDCSFFKRQGGRLVHLSDIGDGAEEKARFLALTLQDAKVSD